MNRYHPILFNGIFLVLLGFIGQAQQSRTYTETYPTNRDTELNINTSHADLEFETWDKDQVEIIAVVELEGVPEEEAESYFERDLVKIMGNSKEIEISTQRGGPFAFSFDGMDLNFPDLPPLAHIMAEMEIPEIHDLDLLPKISVIPAMPPIPPMPEVEFDYQAYKKDKEKYMEKWRKDFDKSFGEEYKKKFEAWGEQMEERAKEWQAKREKLMEKREELNRQQEQRNKELRMELDKQRKKQLQEREVVVKQRAELERKPGAPNVFYFSSDGKSKEYKVKKRIKIKMPKYLKMNLNVRHGEVKLANNTKNINARLTHASLLASTIDGNQTQISASYSPVSVQQWNYGKLDTNYSEKVDLREVGELDLDSNASNVVIGRLVDSAQLFNRFGTLSIATVSDGFKTIDISVENGELGLKLPQVPCVIVMDGTNSDFQYPKSLKLESSTHSGTTVLRGHHIDKNGGSISISSKYSEVALKD